MQGGYVKNDASRGTGLGGGSFGSNKCLYPATSGYLRSLTVTGLGLVVHKHKFSSVTMLGRVVEVTNLTTRIDVKIKDPFGAAILVQYWKPDDDDKKAGNFDFVVLGSWVRVFGTPKKSPQLNDGDVVIQAFTILPVNGLHEITGHFMESMVANMCLKKMANNLEYGLPGQHGLPNASQNQTTFANEAVPSGVGSSSFSGPTSSHGTPFNANRASNANDPAKIILKHIQDHSEDTDNGVSVDDLMKHPVLRNLGVKFIREKLDHYSTEGHIYSTIDDDHFKSTD